MGSNPRITFSLGRDDKALKDWYESIPAEYRTMMVKLAIVNAVNSGLADVDTYFPKLRARPPAKSAETPVTKELQDPSKKTAERIPSTISAQERTDERKPAEKPGESPSAQKGEDLLAFTLANLPKGCTPDLRVCAEKFPRAVPYTLEDLVSLKGMLKLLDEPSPQTGQN